MEDKKKSTLDYMMHYGALLGFFWIFKYSFFIGQAYWIHFIYFFHLLNVVSPLLMYVFYLRYRAETPDLRHDTWRCVLFVVGISFFGSLFEAVIIYAHYAFINPDFFHKLSSAYIGLGIATVESLGKIELFVKIFQPRTEELKVMMEHLYSTKMVYVVFNLLNNLFMGFVFSLFIGFITRSQTSK